MPPSPLLIAFGLSMGAVVALGFARFAYALLLPAMQADLGWSYTLAGGMNAANAVGYLVGSLAAPAVMGRLGVRGAFGWGIFLTALALLACGFSADYTVLLALRLIAGATGAVIFIAGGALASVVANRLPGRAALIIGTYFGGVGLGILLTGVSLPFPLGANLALWPQAWVGLGLATLAALGVAVWAVRQVEEPLARGGAGREPWSLHPLLPALLAYFLFALGYIAYMTFIISFLRQSGFAAWQIAACWGLLGLSVMAATGIWGRLIDRSQNGQAMMILLLTVAAGSVLPLLGSSFGLMLVSAALFGLGFLPVVTAMTALVRKFLPATVWPLALSIFTAAFALGQALGPIVTGYISDLTGGLQAGLGLSTAVLLLGAVAAWRQGNKKLGTG